MFWLKFIKREGKEMIEGAIQVNVKVVLFSEVEPGTYFILLNEKPGYEGVEIVADKNHYYAHFFLKLHNAKEWESNAQSYNDHLLCYIEPERKIVPIKIW